MPIGTGDDQIRPLRRCETDQLVGDPALGMGGDGRTGLHIVSRQVPDHVASMHQWLGFRRCIVDFDDDNGFGALKERQCITQRSTRLPIVLLPDDDAHR